MLVAGSKSGHVHVIAADSGKALQSLMLGQPSASRSTGTPHKTRQDKSYICSSQPG